MLVHLIPLSAPFAIVILEEPDHEPPLVGTGAIRRHWVHKHRHDPQHSRFGHENEFEDLPVKHLISVDFDVEIEVAACGGPATFVFVICY